MNTTINQQDLVGMTRTAVLSNPSTKLYWMTINPHHGLFINGSDGISPAVPRSEFALSSKRLSEARLIQKTGRITARLAKQAICRTLTQIDPRFDPSNPARRMKRDAHIAMYLIPAVRRSAKQRFIHYHGWILLNAQPTPAEPQPTPTDPEPAPEPAGGKTKRKKRTLRETHLLSQEYDDMLQSYQSTNSVEKSCKKLGIGTRSMFFRRRFIAELQKVDPDLFDVLSLQAKTDGTAMLAFNNRN